MYKSVPSDVEVINHIRIDNLHNQIIERTSDAYLANLSANLCRISEWLLIFSEARIDDFIEICQKLIQIQSEAQSYLPSLFQYSSLTNTASLSLDFAQYSKNLRFNFEREMASTIVAELLGVNDTKATMESMTLLAEESLQCACAYACASLVQKHGTPDVTHPSTENSAQQRGQTHHSNASDPSALNTIVSKQSIINQWQNHGFVVLGMGKLGGGELNLSSDIDLIFAFEKEGMTNAKSGQRTISHSQFYTKMAQMLIRLLDEVTEFGRVFRVDARLRPHGDSGPLVMSFSSMENYYQLHGREWERYAWIKARCVAGDVTKAHLLLKILKPFVYRKYVDYRIVRSIKKMRDMIYLELKQKGIEQNIKLGHGGIRMIEFVVQTYQLLYGGRYPALKNVALYAALKQLEVMNMVDTEQASKLYQAYLFLRQLEHRIQMHRCQQTHDLPQDNVGIARIAWSLHYSSVNEFFKDLNHHRDYVQTIFESLTKIDEGVDESNDTLSSNVEGSKGENQEVQLPSSKVKSNLQDNTAIYKLVWQKLVNNDAIDALIEEDVFLTEPVIKELKSYIHGKSYGLISADGKDILQSLIPKLMHYCSQRANSHISIRRSLRVINSIGQRVLYLELLNSNSRVCQNFVDYVSASQWVCQWLSNYPIVIEMLLEKNQLNFSDTLKAYRDVLENRIHGNADIELVMDVLRQFHHGQVLKIALKDVQKLAPVLVNKSYDIAVIEQVYDIRFKLSILAQSLIETALRVACDQLSDKFGVTFKTVQSSFGIVAYGKLGTEEISYDSDLDLVFVFDDSCDLGNPELDRSYYFIRLARKLISILSLPTASGVLYEIDSRLRPSGNSGLLVTSMSKFERYQKNEAWVWEHQALQKSRMIFGSQSFVSEFERVRQAILSMKREPEKLAEDVANMRDKMKQQSSSDNHSQKISYKHMEGGLIDIEFFCQYMVLKHGHAWPQICHGRKVSDVLTDLCAVGLISEKDKAELGQFYTLLLFLENHEKLFVQNNHDSNLLEEVANQKKVTEVKTTQNEASLLSAEKDAYTIDHLQKDKESSEAESALAYFAETQNYVTNFCYEHYLSKSPY